MLEPAILTFLRHVKCNVVLYLLFLFWWSSIVVNSVNNFMLLRYVWNAFLFELLCILVHIEFYVFKWKPDRLLYLLEILYLLDLIVRKLILLGVKNAFISKNLLPFLLSDDVHGRLFCPIESYRGFIECKRVQEPCLPIWGVQVQLKLPLLSYVSWRLPFGYDFVSFIICGFFNYLGTPLFNLGNFLKALLHLLPNFFIAFFVSGLFVIWVLECKSEFLLFFRLFSLLFRLFPDRNQLVTIFLVSFRVLHLGPVILLLAAARIDIEGICKPTGRVPARLQQSSCQWLFLKQDCLVASVWLNVQLF